MVSMPSACESAGEAMRAIWPSMQDFAAVDRVRAREHLHQRRLAGAVVAQHRDHFAGVQLQVHVFDGAHAAEGLVHARDLDQGDAHDSLSPV